MEVAEKDRCFGACDNQNDEDKKEESIHIVNMRGPDRIKNEE